MRERRRKGTTIGFSAIKKRRLKESTLRHPVRRRLRSVLILLPTTDAFTGANRLSSSSVSGRFARLDQLDEIDWIAVLRSNWSREFHRGKEAEFLVEWSLLWELVSRVCVRLAAVREQVYYFLGVAEYQPRLELAPAWHFE